MRPRDRLGLCAAITIERGPYSSKGEQRSVVIEREPDDILFLGLGIGSRAYRRDQTTAIASGRSTPPRGLLLNGNDVERGISALIKTEVSIPATVEH